jgi:hypothetical protein
VLSISIATSNRMRSRPSASGTWTPICQKCGARDPVLALSQHAQPVAVEDLACPLLDLLEVGRPRDEHVRDSERRIERQTGSVSAGADLLLPDHPGNVDHRAAPVAFAVDVAGAVQHLLQGHEPLLDHVVRGATVLADGGIERAGVLVLDRLGALQRPVGLCGRVVIAALPSPGGRVLLGQLRRMSAHLSSRVPRLLRAGARRVRGTRNYSQQGSRGTVGHDGEAREGVLIAKSRKMYGRSDWRPAIRARSQAG